MLQPQITDFTVEKVNSFPVKAAEEKQDDVYSRALSRKLEKIHGNGGNTAGNVDRRIEVILFV